MTQANEIAALRDALRKIIAVPVGYHAAAKMEGIARAALDAAKTSAVPTPAILGDQGDAG